MSIQDAIAAAQQAAAQVVPATIQPGTAVSMVGAGTPLGLNDMMAGSMSVDAWLKVKDVGLFVGGDMRVFEELKLGVDMSEVQYCESIKYGNPAQYDKSYDRVVSARGGSWADAITKAQKVDPNARTFRSADIPFLALEEVKGKDKTTLVEVGGTIGHSLSTTGWKAWTALVKDLQKKGIDPTTAKITMTVKSLPQKSNKGSWGILDFSDVEVVDAFPFEEV
jgi:hypothetical protein